MNSFRPIANIKGNWSYVYQISYGGCPINKYNDLPCNPEQDSPFYHNFGGVYHCWSYLAPHGSYFKPNNATWHYFDAIYMNQYDLSAQFYGGSAGRTIQRTKSGEVYDSHDYWN